MSKRKVNPMGWPDLLIPSNPEWGEKDRYVGDSIDE